jgi:hypothetical protein
MRVLIWGVWAAVVATLALVAWVFTGAVQFALPALGLSPDSWIWAMANWMPPLAWAMFTVISIALLAVAAAAHLALSRPDMALKGLAAATAGRVLGGRKAWLAAALWQWLRHRASTTPPRGHRF